MRVSASSPPAAELRNYCVSRGLSLRVGSHVARHVRLVMPRPHWMPRALRPGTSQGTLRGASDAEPVDSFKDAVHCTSRVTQALEQTDFQGYVVAWTPHVKCLCTARDATTFLQLRPVARVCTIIAVEMSSHIAKGSSSITQLFFLTKRLEKSLCNFTGTIFVPHENPAFRTNGFSPYEKQVSVQPHDSVLDQKY